MEMQFINKYIDDTLSQSRLVSSHKKNAFKYLIDQYESSSEYNIVVSGIVNFNESNHQNKKAYGITLQKDAGSKDNRSRLGFNLYPQDVGTYIMIFEFFHLK